jgi:hypothetical protein
VSRLILAFAVVVLAQPVYALGGAWAAQPDWEYREAEREARREAREARREAQREAREAAREARQDAWEARRESWEWRNHERGVHLRILRNFRLEEGQSVDEPIVVIAGSAVINGTAESDVTVIGGSLDVGPRAVIRGNVESVGGGVTIAPTAQVIGRIDETSVIWPNVDLDFGAVPQGWWAAASLGAMILRLGLVLFVCLLITWFAPGWTGSIGARARDAAGTSLFVGLTTQVLFVPALVILCVILVITIIGIPLLLALPFALAFAALAWTAGFAGVVSWIGRRLRGQSPGASTSPTLDLLTGFAAVSALTVIAHFLALGPWWTRPGWFAVMASGWLIEWVVWTLGLGAMLTSMLGRRDDEPPAIPIIPQSAPSTF